MDEDVKKIINELKVEINTLKSEIEGKQSSSLKNQLYQSRLTILLTILDFAILGIGLLAAFYFNKFTIIPFAVVLTGIVTFFGVLIISDRVLKTDDVTGGSMRRALTSAIVVVYLGLLPTMAFQGMIQYQIIDSNSLNLTLNQTAQFIPMELSETVVTSFTTLVTAVILFYFGSRTWENLKTIEANAKTDSNQQKDQ
jgi:hypothetical protein